VVADALLGLKHGGRRHLIRPLGAVLAPALAAALGRGVDAVMPVPLHPRRLRRRGFNQSLEILRAALAAARPSAAPVPLLVDDLRRVRDTPPLGHEPPPVRRSYVRGAFTVPRPRRVQGRRLLVVDDVMTTGATLAECARTLRRAGAADVTVLALACAAPP
jgi:predicted amidophosphoribosyltransferase